MTFAVALLGGTAIGLAMGWIVAHVRARIEDTPVEMTISLLTPYAAFLPAQQLGVSGVIASVAAGLYLGRRGSQIMGPDARLTGRAVWETISYLLHGAIFIITGLEVPLLLRALAPAHAIRRRYRHRGEPGPGRGRALWILRDRVLAAVRSRRAAPPRLVAQSSCCRGPACAASSRSRSRSLSAVAAGRRVVSAREAILIVT
jgi:hypothetical protein